MLINNDDDDDCQYGQSKQKLNVDTQVKLQTFISVAVSLEKHYKINSVIQIPKQAGVPKEIFF